MKKGKTETKTFAIVKLSDEFASAVYSDLMADKLKPVFAVLDEHEAAIVGDYRNSIQDFAEVYGRYPQEGFFEGVRASFNANPMRDKKWLALEAPADKAGDALRALKTVNGKKFVEEVVLLRQQEYKRG